jgi:tape measure domain-containing protein
MAIRAAELHVVIGADTNPAVQGIRNAMGTIGSAASTALGVFSGVLMSQAVSSLGTLAMSGVQAVGEFERLSATLETLVKRDLARTGKGIDQASEKTQELLTWVQQLAKESPFDSSGVTVALRTAMAFGFTADEAQRLTRAMIDYAAGAGLSEDVMNQIALALGQIKANGKLAGQEMLQLVNAGIDVRDALARALGISVQQVVERLNKGAIDANTAIEAIVSTLETDFAGAARAQADTVSGLLSTLGELQQIGLRELFAGIVEALRPVVSTFIEWLQDTGIAKLREIGQGIGNIVIQARQFAQDAAPAFQVAMAWIKDNGETIRGALLGISLAFGALTVVGTVTALVSALINPITLVVAAAGLLGAAWVNNWGGIREKTAEVWAWLQPILSDIIDCLQGNIPQALAALQSVWAPIWEGIRETTAAVWSALQPVLSDAINWLQANIPQALATLQSFWESIWEENRGTVALFWAVLQPILSDIIDCLQGNIPQALAALQSVWETVWEGARGTVAVIWDALQPILSDIIDCLQGNIPQALAALQSVWETVWEGVQASLNASLLNMLSTYQGFRGMLQGDWNGLGTTLQGTWDSLWSTITQIASNAWSTLRSGVVSLVQSVATTFSSFDWRAVGSNIVSGIASGISGAVNSLVQAAKDAATAALNSARDALGIRSPSRVFEALGEAMMQGWVRGIERMTPRLEVAVGGASSRAVQAATINNYYNLTVQSTRSAEQIERDFWLMRG